MGACTIGLIMKSTKRVQAWEEGLMIGNACWGGSWEDYYEVIGKCDWKCESSLQLCIQFPSAKKHMILWFPSENNTSFKPSEKGAKLLLHIS